MRALQGHGHGDAQVLGVRRFGEGRRAGAGGLPAKVRGAMIPFSVVAVCDANALCSSTYTTSTDSDFGTDKTSITCPVCEAQLSISPWSDDYVTYSLTATNRDLPEPPPRPKTVAPLAVREKAFMPQARAVAFRAPVRLDGRGYLR